MKRHDRRLPCDWGVRKGKKRIKREEQKGQSHSKKTPTHPLGKVRRPEGVRGVRSYSLNQGWDNDI